MNTTLFCVDFDETLMNTDRLKVDIIETIRSLGKEELVATYLEAYEATRQEFGVPRVPLALKTMAERYALDRSTLSRISDIFHTFSYQDYLYDGAEEAITHLKNFGKVVLFSDGDAFSQPTKVYATSIATLVDGILILPGKTNYFADLSGFWPAGKYVFIDDKQKVLDTAKDYFAHRSTTVFVQQGRYASEVKASSADVVVPTISEVTKLSF